MVIMRVKDLIEKLQQFNMEADCWATDVGIEIGEAYGETGFITNGGIVEKYESFECGCFLDGCERCADLERE